MRTNIFDRLSFLSIFLVIVLLPVFCLPFTVFSVESSKGLLLVAGLAIGVVFWAIARFLDGKIVFPKSKLILAGLGIVLVFLLSALFSKNGEVSMFGTLFDIGSFWFIFAAFALMFMSAITFRTPKQAKIVLLGSILSSAFVLIFQTVHLFAVRFTSLGMQELTVKTGSLLGSWNVLGIFAGFAGLMFLLVVEFFPISKIEKILLQVFILISILLAAAVNFSLVWALLGVSSLIIFVYKASITLHKGEGGEEKEKKQFPLTSFIVMIVALLFFISSPSFSNLIPNFLKISLPEVSVNFSGTMSITKGVIMHYPVLGIGPNRFGEAWSMYKTSDINQGLFWNTLFNSGSGLLTTFVATTGILGILSWIIFFVLFLIIGVKSVFSSIKNGINWEMMAFFVLSLYLFISSFYYFTGSVVFLLSLAFTGIFIGLASSNSDSEMTMSFLNDHRKSFFSILVLILIVVLSVTAAFKYIERFASLSYLGRAIVSVNNDNLPAAANYMSQAVALYPNDLYWRSYSQVYLTALSSVIKKGSNLSDADKTELTNDYQNSLTLARNAVNADSKNYLNYQLVGAIEQTGGDLGDKSSYDKAVVDYKAASDLNPLNPSLKLSIAIASLGNGKIEEADIYTKAALALKGDYPDALVVLSQIEKNQGYTADALTHAQQALDLDPWNKNLIQYVSSFSNTSSTTTPTAPTTTPVKTKK